MMLLSISMITAVILSAGYICWHGSPKQIYKRIRRRTQQDDRRSAEFYRDIYKW